jgi:Holliday junction resolvase-like predicted endonuclease
VAAVDGEKLRRVRRAAEAWLHAHPEVTARDVSLEVAAITAGRLRRLRVDPE